jgi:SAM-dependent methyltransferase
VSHLNDPGLVRDQYAGEQNLRARQALYDETTGPEPKATLFDAIAAGSPRRVLEVGGGEGWLSERIQTNLGAEVTMLDLSPRMVELATARGVHAEVGDVQQLPFEDESFDTVVAAWVLYHVPDLDRGLAEIARVLEPAGRLVCNTNSLHHLAELRDLIGYPRNEGSFAFNAENAEAILGRHFGVVERFDAMGTVTVRDRQKLVDYRASLMVETSPIPADVPLPFVIRIGGAVFVAQK